MWTQEEAVLLERFKDLIGAKGEPSFWGSTDGDVPKSMQDQVKLRKEHWEMALNSLPSEDMLSASTDLCEFSDGGLSVCRSDEHALVRGKGFDGQDRISR